MPIIHKHSLERDSCFLNETRDEEEAPTAAGNEFRVIFKFHSHSPEDFRISRESFSTQLRLPSCVLFEFPISSF